MTKSKPFILTVAAIIIAFLLCFGAFKAYDRYQLKKVNDEADAQHEYYQNELKKAAKPH